MSATDEDLTLRVNEIFYSLQGEGFHTGTPAVFVRLSGCNLKCDFCDTDHSSYHPMSVSEIVARVKEHKAPIVILTGGEPSLQPIGPLVDMLHNEGFKVHIETNGTHNLPPTIDWVTCSPKKNGRLVLTRCDELKVVYEGQDVEAVARGIDAGWRFLQPCSCRNTDEVIAYILDHPWWRLSVQTHKLLNFC
ncbi:MAG: 7-carboxy-7-deazaguanine synthase QueE [Clostridiales bacterium]|nr:7-carboxy-7-deazaguanine synthase QueE [Clostridiales bacterium]